MIALGIWVIALSQVMRTMLDARVARNRGVKLTTLIPRRLRRRKHRPVRVSEMP